VCVRGVVCSRRVWCVSGVWFVPEGYGVCQGCGLCRNGVVRIFDFVDRIAWVSVSCVCGVRVTIARRSLFVKEG